MTDSTSFTASDLLGKVLVERVEIDGHALSYDAENEVIWITNPYGVDAGMIEPTEESCKDFLNCIAAGAVYGPEP